MDVCKNLLIDIKNVILAVLAEQKKTTLELEKLNQTIGGN